MSAPGRSDSHHVVVRAENYTFGIIVQVVKYRDTILRGNWWQVYCTVLRRGWQQQQVSQLERFNKSCSAEGVTRRDAPAAYSVLRRRNQEISAAEG